MGISRDWDDSLDFSFPEVCQRFERPKLKGLLARWSYDLLVPWGASRTFNPGAISGSAVVKIIEDNASDVQCLLSRLHDFVGEMKSATAFDALQS